MSEATPPSSPEPASTPTFASWLNELRHSQLMRIFGIGLLILLLQIPVGMIRGVVSEREMRRSEAVAEVTGRFGRSQSVRGPRLVVPYQVRTEHVFAGVVRHEEELRHAHFLPEELEARGELDSRTLHRGIFEVPVYEIGLSLAGRFEPPEIPEADVILWDRAHLVLELSDARAIQRAVTVRFGEDETPFLPGAGEAGSTQEAIHAPIGAAAQEGGSFSMVADLKGSGGFFFAPFGSETRLELRSSWPDPSFQGAWLPSSREVTAEGFRASWEVPHLGRNYPRQWSHHAEFDDVVAASAFGVTLATPVDAYRMTERSAKYATLFLALTFGALWLFEVLAGVVVHPIQYLLVGAAMCLFYLLELSLAEHVGFALAYATASAGVVVLIAGYSASILGRNRRALVVGSLVMALYAYLYVLLRNQDFALLAGSLGLFVILGGVMYLTRRIDWSALGHRIAATTRGS
ncbi:MAG: cell envelope integrity protein CreD [Myxococcota bacterium]|nr:cell envelope integrity protein CreD [Myxococcota bacterium]